MKIYTKTGDRGSTALVGGKRVPKTHVRLEAYGTVDELNAALGWLLAEMGGSAWAPLVQQVQHWLFTVGAELATERTSLPDLAPLPDRAVTDLERAIDEMNETLPPLKAFVLPGGCRAAGVCHMARTVCRRAERAIFRVAESAPVHPEVMCFMNRLSDFLFVLARVLNQEQHGREIFWDNGCR